MIAILRVVDPSLERVLQSTLARYPEVRLALVFGSRARGSAGEASDVDVAVSAPGLDLFALAASLSERAGLEVDVVDLDGDVPIPLLEAIVRDGRGIHRRSSAAEASWRTRSLLTLETDGPWYRRMRDAWLDRVAERGVMKKSDPDQNRTVASRPTSRLTAVPPSARIQNVGTIRSAPISKSVVIA